MMNMEDFKITQLVAETLNFAGLVGSLKGFISSIDPSIKFLMQFA